MAKATSTPELMKLTAFLSRAAALLLLPFAAAHADELYWDFATASPASVPGNLTVVPVTQGNNNGTTTLISSGSASSGYTGSSGTNNAGLAVFTGALNTATSSYFEVTLQPASGYRVTLTDISFGARRTGTGPVNYSLFSSVDSYAAAVVTGANPASTTWGLVSHSALNVTSVSPLTLRLYGHDGSGNAAANTANWRIDDLKLTVTVSQDGAPVPTIASVDPLSGQPGTAVTITGTNFGPTPTVSFNGTPATSVTVNPEGTSITTAVPAAATTGLISVGAPGGSVSSADPFTVIPLPSFAVSIEPSTVLENAANPAAVGVVSILDPAAADLTVTLSSSNPAAATVLPSVTILTGQTSALFDVTAVPNPASFGNEQSTITASAAGYVSGTATVTVQNTDTVSTSVVVNKYLNGSPDLVELLVIGNGTPGSTVDMRGMLIKDFSASMANDGGGKFRFNAVEAFSAVKAGTLIVIQFNSTTTDTDPSDYVLRLGLADVGFFTNETTSGAFDVATTDMVMIKGPGAPATGVDGAMHALAGGVAGAQFTNTTSKKLIASGTSGTGRAVIANNTTSAFADFDGIDATGNLALTAADFGLGHSAGNLAYIRSLRGITSVDGTGLAAITNATPASIYAGKNTFSRNQPAQTVALTLTGNVSGTPLTSVKVVVPAAFGAPVAGSATLSGAAAGAGIVDVTGQEITVTGVAVTPTETLTISIAGLTSPNPVAVTDDGSYPFLVSTAGDAGVLTAIPAQPTAVVTIPVANLRDVDADGVSPDNGKTVAVEVVCTEANFNAAGSTSAYGQDGNFGINIFYAAGDLGLTRGVRYAITGAIAQFNGLTEIIPASISAVTSIGPETEPSPLVISVPDLLANAEAYEGRLVKVTGLSYSSGTWALASSVTATDALLNALDIRIQAGSDATTAPGWPANITGVFGQFDNSAPRTGGYQLMPRDAADIESLGGSGYEGWAAGYGLNGTAEDDDDLDGASNLLEYATGSVPNDNKSVPNYLLTPIGPTLTVTWAKGAVAATDSSLTWIVEASPTMAADSWTTDGVLNLQDGATSISADYAISPATPKIFLRLRVVRALAVAAQ